MTPARFTDKAIIEKALAGRRVLIVEDEFLIALEIEITLEEVGAKPVLAGSIAQAEAALEGKIDAAVLDVRLPDGDSVPIARRLAERGAPFLFQSAHFGALDLPPGIDAPLLTKPIAPGRILSELAILLGAEPADG
jgi:DNA-binding response OmpR family regulator